MTNIRRCKYFLMTDEPGDEMIFDSARQGWFMGIYQNGDRAVAYVEAYTGEIHETFPEYIRLEKTDLDVLLDRILDETGGRVQSRSGRSLRSS